MEPTKAVVEAIQKKFFPDVEQIRKVLAELKYDSLNGYWYFTWAGMHVGIESDGYMHT